MKQLKTFLQGFILAAVLITFGGFLGYRYANQQCQETVNDIYSQLDSIASIAPDTLTVIDTVFLEADTVFLKREVPEPEIISADTNLYQDKITGKGFQAWITDTIKGSLLSRHVRILETGPQIIKEYNRIEIPVPVPVNRIAEPEPFIVLTGGFGGNFEGVGWSLGAEYVSVSNYVYGAEYLKLGSTGNLLLKLGIKF